MKYALYSSTAMLALLAITGCSDDIKWDLFRSSENIPTQAIYLQVEAAVHTHLGETEQEDETHTTLTAQMHGYDTQGYFYAIELGPSDTLLAASGDASIPMMAEYLPSQAQKADVLYSADFDLVDALTNFTVTLSRTSGPSTPIEVSLPDLTEFTLAPNSGTTPLDSAITVAWVEAPEYKYRLRFDFVCLDDDGTRHRLALPVPNAFEPELNTPYEFTPADVFTPEDYPELSSCQLHSNLLVLKPQDAPQNNEFKDIFVWAKRQQTIIQSLTF